MDFSLTDIERSWHAKAQALARAFSGDAAAEEVVRQAASQGLFDPGAGLLAAAVAVEALACESAAAALAFALHAGVIALETHGRRGLARLLQGSVTDKVVRGAHVPVLVHHHHHGRQEERRPVGV